MKQTVAYHAFRIVWFICGPAVSYLMCRGVAIGVAMAGAYGGFTRHEIVSMNSLMLFSVMASVLGILALIGTRYRWNRVSGRLVLYCVSPILLAIHLNYSGASSGPVHNMDLSFATGLISSLAAAIALWEFTCWLGRRYETNTAEQ